VQFKTFSSYDTQDLDNQINNWLQEAYKQRQQVLDVKVNTSFSPDGKPFFSANMIYQQVPETKSVPNPCCKKQPQEAQEPVVQKEGEEPQEGMIPTPEAPCPQAEAAPQEPVANE